MKEDVILSSHPSYLVAEIILILFALAFFMTVFFNFFYLIKINKKVNKIGQLIEKLQNGTKN